MPILSTIAAATVKAYGAFSQPIVTDDTNFEYVSLLLPGNGTNGAQNNTFIDSSTNAYTVTRTGNTAQGTFSPFSRSNGYWSNFFDGTLDGLFFPNSTDWDIGQTSTYSAECWVLLNSVVNGRLIIGSSNRWWLNVGFSGVTNDKFGVSFWSGSAWQSVSGTTTISVGVWYHIAFTYNNGTAKLYVNGTEEGSLGSITTTTGTLEFSVGGVSSSYEINGYVSNVRVIKGGTLVYTGNFTPSTTPLTTTANTVLLTCQNNRFVDNSSSNRTATFTGTPSVQVFNPFEPTVAWSASTNGGSGYFDGGGDYLSVAQTLWSQNGNATFEAWLYVTDNSVQRAIFDTSSSGDFCTNTNNSIRVHPAASNYFDTPANALQVNAWNHVALVQTATTREIFVNGKKQTQTNVNGSPNTVSWTNPTGTLNIGKAGVRNDMKGFIAGVRITNTAVYTVDFSIPTAPPTAITGTNLLINSTNAGIYDAAAFSNFETVGNIQIDTSTSKWGGSSIGGANGSSYLVSYNGATVGNFGNGDFTVEGWIKTNTSSGAPGVFTQATGSGALNTSWGFFIGYASSTSIDFYVSNGSSYFANTGGGNVTDNAWHHIAFSRSGSNGRLFLDGTQVGSTLSLGTTALGNGTTPINLFAQGNVGVMTQGNLQDLRITKGVARYTANFTPPTAAFPLF